MNRETLKEKIVVQRVLDKENDTECSVIMFRVEQEYRKIYIELYWCVHFKELNSRHSI